MMEFPLDERLATIAALVRDGVIVADVGCDHAYLACHLVASRKCPRAYACDVNQGPLAIARRNIMAHNLGSRILVLCTDGLQGVPLDCVGDVVIAGMGGDLIARILLECQCCQNNWMQFILQPMSKPEHLRVALYRGGFALRDEVAVICGKFVYTVMVAQFTGASVEVSTFFAWTGLIWDQPLTPPVLAYLTSVHETLCKKAEGYAKSGQNPLLALEYAEMAQRICCRIEQGC